MYLSGVSELGDKIIKSQNGDSNSGPLVNCIQMEILDQRTATVLFRLLTNIHNGD